MTRKKRNIVFVSLVILFLIVAPIMVFYSLGWRFDWETKKIVQAGVFYFKVWPKNSQVYLDGILKKKTDLFFGSVLIENLLPKKYQIEIKKEGYHDWKKTLEIKKRQATEVKNIVLIPKELSSNISTKGIKGFFFAPDGKKIILKEENENGWSLKLFELKNNLKSHLINEKDISIKSVELFDLKFSPDSTRILLEAGLKERINYYILEIDKSPATIVYLDFLDSVDKIYFHPQDPEKLLALRSQMLNEIDFADKEILSPLLKDVVSYAVLGQDAYCLNSSGFLFKEKEKLNIIPLEIKKETEYEIIASSSHIFLKENNILYIFNQSKKSFERFFEPIKDLKFSPDSKKLVYFNNYEIWVLFLEKQYDQPEKEAGEQLFITRFSEEIGNIFWYTNHYLIFNIGNKIKVAEIDDRDKINIIDLAQFPEPEIFWSDKKLYLLSEENFYVSQELTP